MRSDRLQIQLMERLAYEGFEFDLPAISDWAKGHFNEGAEAQKAYKIVSSLSEFLDSVDSTYSELTSSNNALTNANAESEVEKKALQEHFRKVANFLNNLKQSAFLVIHDGTIKGPVSKFSNNIFDQSIVGKNIFDILYKSMSKDTEEFSALHTAFITVYGEDELQWELMWDYFPNRIISKFDGKEKILKVDTSPMWSEDGMLEALIYVVEDITELEALTKKVELEKQKGSHKLQLMQELMSCSADDAKEFFEKTDELINEIHTVLGKTTWDKDDVNKIFRSLHTIKGNARSYNFVHLSAATHKVESDFCAIQDINFELPFFERNSMPTLMDQLTEYKEMVKKIYQTNHESTTASSKVKNQIANIRQVIKENQSKLPPQVVSSLNEIFADMLDESCLPPIKKLVENTVKVTAADCGKDVAFEVHGTNFIAPEVIMSLLKDSIVHIVRNAIDHGIESKEARILAGKKPVGTITVNILPSENWLQVEIADDGGGIDTNRLRKKAIDLHFMKQSEADKASQDQLINLLFMPGFTTKEKVTETSGRGVGLDVARENIEKIGGRLHVESIFGMGTTFILSLPFEESIELLGSTAA